MLKRIIAVRHLPVVVSVLYLIFTLLLFQFGPFEWEDSKRLEFWVLQTLYIVALIFGWIISYKQTIKKTTKIRNRWTNEKEICFLKFYKYPLLFNLFLEVINLFRTFYFKTFDFFGLFQKIIFGIQNPGISYEIFQSQINTSGSQVLGGSFITVINIVWDIVSLLIILMGILYFKKLKKSDKITLVINIILIFIKYLSIGTNIGIFRIALAIIVFYIVYYICKIKREDNKNKMRFIKIVISFFIFVIVFCAIFSFFMESRGGILQWESSQYNIDGYGLNMNSIFFKIIPPTLYTLMISASSYLTQGYNGMLLGLSLPWIPMYGLGFSKAVSNFISEYFIDISSLSYEVRVQQAFGWQADVRWHSMYTWFANDVSYLGVVVIIFIIGFTMQKAYSDSLEDNNPFAKIMLYFFALMIFFMPCNNQVFQSFTTMLPFFLSLFLWLYFRGTLNIKAITNKIRRKNND